MSVIRPDAPEQLLETDGEPVGYQTCLVQGRVRTLVPFFLQEQRDVRVHGTDRYQ